MANLDEIRKNIILKPGVHYFDYTASGLAYEPVEEISGAARHLPAACDQRRDRRGKFTRRTASARARFAVRTSLKPA